MGCRITVSQHDPNEEAKTTSKITEGLAEGGLMEDQAKDSGSKYSENFDGSKTTEDPKAKEVPERVPATTSDITLLSLPTEMLVKIISLLETRDRVKLRYVSKKYDTLVQLHHSGKILYGRIASVVKKDVYTM